MFVIILLLAIIALLLLLKGPRDKFVEEIKDLSDRLLLWFLRATSRFEGELTQEGKSEQAIWREQRLRDLQGLSIRSRQRLGDKDKVA